MTELTLPQIRSAKTTMEQAIARAADEAISKFQKETGIQVVQVNVDLVQVDRIDAPPFSVIDRIHTELDLKI